MTLKPFAAAVALLAPALTGCGFKPIYATPVASAEGSAGAAISHAIAVRQVSAPETVAPYLNDALDRRLPLRQGQSPRYELYVQARERAERLAVQIDATVTRFNYRLIGKYTLVDLQTGKRISGGADAIASYNIVTSQYSTLFAERTAQEKAAQLLAANIERDLLIQFSAPETPAPAEDSRPVEIDDETNLIVDAVSDDDPFDAPAPVIIAPELPE